MVFKAALVICVQALLIQSIVGARLAPWAAASCDPLSGPYATAYGPAAASASHGGALPTTSASAIPASGVSIASENAYQGPLSVAGALPFLGTVALEGALPTAGAGAVAFGAGNGEVAMLAEELGPRGLAAPYGARAYPYARSPFGYGPC